MNDALDERVLEASVVAALERIRNEQEKFPDQRVVFEREFSLIQTRLHHFVETIANGKSTDSVIASLHQEEARKRVVVQELSRLDSLAQVFSFDAKRLAKDLRSRLGEDPNPIRSACTTNPPDAQKAPRWHIIGKAAASEGPEA
jgi:hypothetical protein